MLDTLQTAYLSGDFRRLLAATQGSNDLTVTRAWALTVTACFGPCGVSDGVNRPDRTFLAMNWKVASRMVEAWNRLGELLGVTAPFPEV